MNPPSVTCSEKVAGVKPIANDLKESHTPGKWEVSPCKMGFCLEVVADDGCICKVYGTSGTQDETVSNAKLIAAAPELKEALQKCEHVIGTARLQGKLDNSPLSAVNDALIAARSVLDKLC